MIEKRNRQLLQVNRVVDRWVNIFFILSLVVVFIVFANAQDHKQIMIGICLAAFVSLLAFIINWLTIDGALAAGIFGTMAYGLGGIAGAAVVLGFFISGSIVSDRIISKEGFLEKEFRRNGKQVWANGFWFALWLLIWFLYGVDAFLIAAITSIAASTADTWATEIGGKRIKGKTRLLTTWEKVLPGTEGGVSFWGTVAALFGASFIGLVFWGFSSSGDFLSILIITVIGFSGSIVDSYLGARFQHQKIKLTKGSIFGNENAYVSNNFVNWISAGTASIISLILILIIGV